MATLTTREKAARYDSLQVAIKHTKESYQRRRTTAEKQYVEATELGIIGAYTKGQADAFGYIIADLERWAK